MVLLAAAVAAVAAAAAMVVVVVEVVVMVAGGSRLDGRRLADRQTGRQADGSASKVTGRALA